MPPEEIAVMYARCNTCENVRMFRLGEVMTDRDVLRAWSYVKDLRRCPCAECGTTRWNVSIRLGLVGPPLVRDSLAGADTLVLH